MSDITTRLTAALSDRYRIERELGQGGMATVYPAHDIKHETTYFLGQRAVARLGRSVVLAIRLADGEQREVLRFDEPLRPHSTAPNGIAEYGDWLCFTLSDFQSDIRVASVKGLKQ